MKNVPLVDLKANMQNVRKEIEEGFGQVLDQCNFIMGDPMKKFEQEFAQYCKARYCLGVGSGTEALHLAVRAAGVGPGDEVIVPTNSFIATAIGVSEAGGKPVFVDNDPETYLIDISQIEAKITKKTKAIIPVHLYGRIVDMKPIMAIAEKHNLVVIEDAAQAHGAELNSQRVGSIGHMACFSFYPGKNLGAYGDGGAVTTNSEAHAKAIESMRNYGSPQKYHHPVVGFNSRLDTLQAVVLGAKLKHLDSYNQRRYQVAKTYDEMLKGVGDLVLPEIPIEGSHVFHLYVVRTESRDEMMAYLNENGVGAGIHYPIPIHEQGAYEGHGHKPDDFPVAHRYARQMLSLPIYPELSRDQITHVVDTVKAYFANKAKQSA